ncbi:glycerophosphodiester phosphodiesterase [Halopelagius longus]|uniref:Glycerophosphoryl diester phosphodiesterase n=1 Tax=Halopelagius longus TaxID=1236180 RepID=A0A1H1FCJ4_9EURY|nr:glycerophosphodiester phosphodiesterase family protein [Halopelagius longus]RDI70161.1 hypothetical protein DWB78_16210 [Halopelagius longus]SDQ98793.1 glycerophosphoryl diester phosphodiesterase [Halopelagius longus]
MLPIIGHRGRLRAAAENTVRSFEAAAKWGVDGVEFDVRRTGDDELVVIHDATVDRTTTGNGRVDRLSLAEIQSFTTGDGETVPTLEQSLSVISETTLEAWIDLKDPGLVDDVVRAVRRHGLVERTVLFAGQGFVDDIPERAHDAGIRAGITIGPALAGRYGPTDPFAVIDTLDADALLLTTESITDALLRKAVDRSVRAGLLVDC